MASQTELKKRLQVLMKKPENQICSDCPERQPRWASLIVPPPGSPPGSLPIGAFCCLECSGSHRRLGVHISFVRSINLDSWKEKEVRSMENGGNKKVNEAFEGRLSNFGTHNGKPTALADGRTRERYIRDKYERRKFFDPVALHRAYSGEEEEDSDSESEEESEEEERKPEKKRGGKIAPLRAPSEAAQKRVETRRQRLAAARSSTDASRKGKKKVSKKQPPPAQTPLAEVVDLLDFGDFVSSLPVTEPSPSPPSTSESPVLDFFAAQKSPNVNPTVESTNFPNGNPVPTPTHQVHSSAPVADPKPLISEKKKISNEEILSMFNTAPQVYSNNMMTNGNGFAPTNNNIQQMNMQHMPQSQPNMAMNGGGMNMMQQNATPVQSNNWNGMYPVQQQQQQQQQGGNAMHMNKQHMQMMNQMQIGNAGMMMMSAPPAMMQGDHNRQQQMSNMQSNQHQKQMNGFGF